MGILLGAMASVGSGLIGSIGAGKRKRQAARQRREYQSALTKLEQSRQSIIDPFSGITDLSSQITNPFANLQVATQAAEMQAQEADISLASTLDVLRATGRGAGGATALAQAAARSKQGVSASIEKQEAENTRLRAQGEAQRQQRLLSEQIRLQQADVAGKQFTFAAQEQRELTQLDRAQAQLDAATAAENQASAASTASFASALGAAGSALAGLRSNNDESNNSQVDYASIFTNMGSNVPTTLPG